MSYVSVNIFCIPRRYAFAAATYASPHRDYSNSVKVIETPSIPALKRGTGGRSSFSGIVATVFGATGFLGRYVVNELGKTGAQVIIPYRCDADEYDLKKLKLCGDLGQILFQPFDIRDPMSIRKSMKYSNVVINLMGSYFNTRNFSMADVNFKGAKEIAIACRDLNIERLIHLSSLNVTQHPKSYLLPKPIEFLPTKLKGEEAVLTEYPNATIFRPAIVFGRWDKFLWALNARHRLSGHSIPVWAAGEKTVRQPVYVHDLIKGIMMAIADNESKGKIYQAVGLEKYKLSEIVNYCTRVAFGNNHTGGCIDARFDPYLLFKIITVRYMTGGFWYEPTWNLCFEQIEMESVTDVVDMSLPTLEDLGVKLSTFESKAEHIIRSMYLVKEKDFQTYNKYNAVIPPKPYNVIM